MNINLFDYIYFGWNCVNLFNILLWEIKRILIYKGFNWKFFIFKFMNLLCEDDVFLNGDIYVYKIFWCI